ncbi:hypothetical protein [Rossellomorea arthrocnemi]|jgi:hypothetical protein|nr:hypothetical protein [Rossellomorea arthrocnemi]
MTGKKKTSKDIEKYRTLDNGNKTDRNNDNARAAAALDPAAPRIHTDNL